MPTAQRFDAPADGRLTEEMKAAYGRDGFLVLQGFDDASAITALRQRIDELVEGFDEGSVRTIFSTEAQSHAADIYFRESGDEIRFFFEAGAFGEDGALTAAKRRALNKIGHAMHD